MGGGGGGEGRFSGRLGIHCYSFALKYTNIIFLIVGMVVTDFFFFFFFAKISTFQDLHYCKLKKINSNN